MSDKSISEQWNASAGGWAHWAAQAADYLVPATETMLDVAAVGPGARVLDIGCGSGEQTVLAARRAGDAGHVLAIDIAAPMVAAAEKTVAAAGLRNVATRVCAAEALVGSAGPFDAAISRLVLMLIPDPVSAARSVHAVLRPGGRFVALVPGDQAKTGFNAIALDILARHGGKTNWEDKPGSIRSLVDPSRLAAVLRDAGFADVTVMTVPTIQRMPSAGVMTQMIREAFAFYKSLIAALPADRQEAAWVEVEQALRRFEGPDGFAGTSEMNIGVGQKPTG
ncbi:MAG: methyltransferase domain-containing protein [Acetobacteraceae bacterium]